MTGPHGVREPTLDHPVDAADISDEPDFTAANFDGAGNTYSAQALTAAGLAAGAAVTHDGITFTWPDVPPGQPDNVVAQGQTILLSGSGTTLGFLGAGSPGDESGTGPCTTPTATRAASPSRWKTTCATCMPAESQISKSSSGTRRPRNGRPPGRPASRALAAPAGAP